MVWIFVEIPMLNPPAVDAPHTRALLESHGIRAVCSLGLPENAWAVRGPSGGKRSIIFRLRWRKRGKSARKRFSGVTYGGNW